MVNWWRVVLGRDRGTRALGGVLFAGMVCFLNLFTVLFVDAAVKPW